MDEIHIPVGVGDYVLKQMMSRTSPHRQIKIICGGSQIFKGVVVKVLDCDEFVSVGRAITLQDLEHIGYILDDMDYELNSLVEEE